MALVSPLERWISFRRFQSVEASSTHLKGLKPDVSLPGGFDRFEDLKMVLNAPSHRPTRGVHGGEETKLGARTEVHPGTVKASVNSVFMAFITNS